MPDTCETKDGSVMGKRFKPTPDRPFESDLYCRALAMWNTGSHTYAEIATALGLKRSKIGQLLAYARQRGAYVLPLPPGEGQRRAVQSEKKADPVRYRARRSALGKALQRSNALRRAQKPENPAGDKPAGERVRLSSLAISSRYSRRANALRLGTVEPWLNPALHPGLVKVVWDGRKVPVVYPEDFLEYINEGSSVIPASWSMERRLRSAIYVLDSACYDALRLAQMDDRLRASITEARAYAEACNQ